MLLPPVDFEGGDLARSASSLQFSLQLSDLSFQGEDPSDAGEGHPVVGHLRNRRDLVDLGTGVPALAAVGARWLDDTFGVETSNERRLHSEHACHLPHRVQGSVMVVEERGVRVHDQALLPTGSRLSSRVEFVESPR